MALAPCAMDERLSRGRRHPEPHHPYRNDFARDRDRIIHSRAFRRLEAKTQVFTTRLSDHFRNRLTHTIEVSQVARTVSEALQLNSDLCSALALAHDIGHPPFGHAGEKQLDIRMRAHGDRFDHNLHALRIVDQFEQRYLDFPGLNLTFEVREGIIKHSRNYSVAEFPDLVPYLLDELPPLESQLIDFVDEIAYDTADLDGGYESRILSLEQIRDEVPVFGEAYAQIDALYPHGRAKLKFHESLRRILNLITTDLIEQTGHMVKASGVASVNDVRHHSSRLASFSPAIADQIAALKRFLHARLYSDPTISEDRNRSVAALDALFSFFMENPARLPKHYTEAACTQPLHRVVCDYIAGMTDHFLLKQSHELLGIPETISAWS
jgi:dGTPase